MLPSANETVASVAEGGRVVLPASFRKLVGLNVGDEVVLRIENNELRVFTRKQALRNAQEFVQKLAAGAPLSEELIEERRAEAERE